MKKTYELLTLISYGDSSIITFVVIRVTTASKVEDIQVSLYDKIPNTGLELKGLDMGDKKAYFMREGSPDLVVMDMHSLIVVEETYVKVEKPGVTLQQLLEEASLPCNSISDLIEAYGEASIGDSTVNMELLRDDINRLTSYKASTQSIGKATVINISK